MSILDNRSIIKQLDRDNFLAHLYDVPEQLVDGYNLGVGVTIPALYAQAKQVVIVSVGELSPLAELIAAMAQQTSRIPIHVVDDYSLPKWVSNETLVIVLDYSGATEQLLIAYREAAQKKARLIALSVGGDLAGEARRARSLHVALNYGSPARGAFAYIFSCLATLLARLDLLELRETTVTEAAVLSRSLLQSIGADVPQFQNNAKQLAEKIATKRTVIVGSGPLLPMSRKWQLSFASTGKALVTQSSLSQMNEAVINAIKPHVKGGDTYFVVMLQSKHDHARNKLQQTLTYQVTQAQKVSYEQIFMHPSGSLFGEIVLAALLGDMVGYYLSLLCGTSPAANEASDYIRTHLPTGSLFE